MWIWIRNTVVFFLANLHLWTGTPHKFADLLLRNEPKNLRISDLRTGTPHKFADMLLRKEPKNLRICDMRNNKKNCMPTFG